MGRHHGAARPIACSAATCVAVLSAQAVRQVPCRGLIDLKTRVHLSDL